MKKYWGILLSFATHYSRIGSLTVKVKKVKL